MANSTTANSLVRRQTDDLALMPPPPIKRIKRPAKVLDEDDYTSALSEIIARDYFPGLHESQAQQEYLAALESGNDAWVSEAGQKLREIITPLAKGHRRVTRNTRFDDTGTTPKHGGRGGPAADTPRGDIGGETPVSISETEIDSVAEAQRDVDTSNLSLSAFQAKYTSEDNESFNTVLDKQNKKRREKHAYLWTRDQALPSTRQIAHRELEAKLLKQKEEDEVNDRALVPMTAGAIASRPAKPDSWKTQKPNNSFMFKPDSIDDEGIQTIQEVREAASKMGHKEVVYSNTRFPPLQYIEDPGPIPPSPSLNTEIIARRDAALGAASSSESATDFDGAETPRVNGYAFVDEDEPDNNPSTVSSSQTSAPSYRDLLAGQVRDGTPNPFKINELRKREDLHNRMVEKQAMKKRAKDKDTIRTPILSGTPVASGKKTTAAMTPAGRKLMLRLGQTPVVDKGIVDEEGGLARDPGSSIWTPRRKPDRTKAQ